MLLVRSDFGLGSLGKAGPSMRTASFAPAAGQNFAETTAKISKATRVSSPEVSPNMGRFVAHAGGAG